MVIDGNSIANRAFYGIRMLNAPDGPHQRDLWFLAILQHAVDEEKPDGLCVTFDLKPPPSGTGSTRATRPRESPCPRSWLSRCPSSRDAGRHEDPRYELEGWEADDLIGTISRKAEARVDVLRGPGQGQLSAGHGQGLYQAREDRMAGRRPSATTGAFEEEYGFPPAGMIDLKASWGTPRTTFPA
jgi:DNA polymerase-1